MNKILVVIIAILLIGSYFGVKGFILTGKATNDNLKQITLSVSIPCPGHAYLIKSELKNLRGIEGIEYQPIKTFIVYYDSNKISPEEILSLNIFKEYSAQII
jgi:copper chaperone CopZ